MSKFILFDNDGKIHSVCDLSPGALPVLPDGMRAIKTTQDVPLNRYVDNDTLIPMADKPSQYHTFNWQKKLWQDPRTLQDLKTAQWDAIKQARSHAEYAGFMWDGSTFDSDAISQNRITGAVALAQMSSAFSIGWVLADNTVRTLGQADMLQVGAALGAHVAAIFAKGVGLRASIEAAATQEQVAAVAW